MILWYLEGIFSHYMSSSSRNIFADIMLLSKKTES